MRAFVEIPLAEEFDVTHMGERDFAHRAEVADKLGDIVVFVRAERARAKRDAVCRAVDKPDQAVKILAAGHDARQAVYAPGGIIGVDCHFDAVFFAGRDNPLEEIFQIVEQLFLVYAAVLLQNALELREPLRLPARQREAL